MKKVTLTLTDEVFDIIRKKMIEAGMTHVRGNPERMNMQNVLVQRDPATKPKKGALLTGAELRFAAKHGIPVWYVEKYHNPHDRHMNFNGVSVMKKANAGYYIGNSDIDPDDYTDVQYMAVEFPEGYMEVREVKGQKYS
jgi:hypothetical protein